jgi:hypothetical protein
MFVALFIILFFIHQWAAFVSLSSILLITLLTFAILILSLKK